MACVKQFPIDSKKGEGRAVGDESVVEMRRQWYRLRREGPDTYECTHTNIASDGEGGRALGQHRTHTPAQWPDQNTGRPGPTIGPCDPAGQEKARRGRWWSGGWQAGLGWRLSLWAEAGLTLARVDTVRQCQCPHHHQAVAVRVAEDKHPWGQTRGHKDWHCRDTQTPPGTPGARGCRKHYLAALYWLIRWNVFKWS